MSETVAPLGFEIDTTALLKGQKATTDFAKEAERAADSVDKLGAAARKSAPAVNQHGDAAQRSGQAAATAATGHTRLAQAAATAGTASATAATQLGSMVDRLTAASPSLMGPQGLVNGLGMASNGLLSFGRTAVGVTAGAGLMAAGIAGVAAGFGGLVLATYKAEERFALYEARLKNVYGSQQTAAAAFADIIQLANDNGVAIDGTAESFLRLARNNEAIGLTRDRMIDLTDAVQKLGRISGASQGELQSGMLQFSQALAAGKLNGDELRSIMENMPALAKAIAEGLGVSVGQMRAMGAEGQLTSEKIVGSLLSELPSINAEFERLPQTSEQAFQRVSNQYDLLLANMGKQLNASGIVKGVGVGMEATLRAANEIVRPATPAEQTEEARQRMLDAQRLEESRNRSGSFPMFTEARAAETAAATLEFQRRANVERYANMVAQDKEVRTAVRAPFDGAGTVIADIDKRAGQVKSLAEQVQKLSSAYENFLENPEMFEADEQERLRKVPEYIVALTQQLVNLRPVMADYQNTTRNMAKDIATYGAGGAAAVAEEARKLSEQAAKSGSAVSFDQAAEAVSARRLVDLQRQTEAMDIQIAAQDRLSGAVGKGAEAQREAELATEAYNLQMQMFGRDVGPEAAAALNDYVSKLRELKEAQADVTDGQRLYNAQVEASIQSQIDAAIAAGSTRGEIDALRRSLELQRDLSQTGGATGTGGVTSRAPMTTGGTDYLRYSNQNATRDDPISENLVKAMSFLQEMGIVMEVFSGGQDALGEGTKRTGSTRHDHGQSADVRFMRDGRMLDYNNADDLPVIQEIVRQAKANGVTGFGAGPGYMSPGSMHVGFGSEMTWGAGGRAETAPAWLREAAGGAAGGAGVSTAGQAVQLEYETQEARIAADAALRLREQRQATERLIEDRNAPDNVARRRLEVDRRAEDAGAGAPPGMASEVAAAERARLIAEDELAYKRLSDAMQAQTDELLEQAKLASLPKRERQIELELLKFIRAEEEAGREVTAARAAEIRSLVTARVDAGETARIAEEDARKYRDVWQVAIDGIGSGLENALVTAAGRGTVKGSELISDMLTEIAVAIFRLTVTKPLTDGLTDLLGLNAHGGAYAGGHALAFAAGGIVNSPSVFPMARGVGLMGEAGPEAILPLKRGPDGKLGVGGGGGGGGGGIDKVIINDMRSGSGSMPVETEQGTGPDGERIISVMVRDEMRKNIASGALDTQNRSSYGVTRQLTPR